MRLSIRKWRIDDKSDLAINLNNPMVMNNLRDGLPYPYTEDDAEEFIRAMLSADEDSTFSFAITLCGLCLNCKTRCNPSRSGLMP